MKALTSPRPVSVSLRTLKPAIAEEVALVRKRAEQPEAWTFEDATRLLTVQRQNQLDAETEENAEGRLLPVGRINPHD